MTTSSVLTDPVDDDFSTPKAVEYRYDLRLEIGGKKAGENVPVVAIFLDLVQRMKKAADENSPLVVLTATDKPFFEQQEIQSEVFQKDFHVDKIEGRLPKVILGFKIRSTTKLSDFKTRLMHTYLIPHMLFLREHVGGFDNGVKTFNYGYLKQDHPDHPDVEGLKRRFMRLASDAWKTLDIADRKKWQQDFPHAFAGNTNVMIPFNFTKEKVSAAHEGKDKLSTTALVVSTPSKYGKIMKTLLDVAVLSKKITNLIPFALSKENPNGYYNIMLAQEAFIENHRNIPITNIPSDANDHIGRKGKTLQDILNANTSVSRVSFDPKQQKYHVSTRADKYRELHQWITNSLKENQFPYHPSVRPMKYGPGSTSAQTYSSVFESFMTAPNDDASTIKTTRSNPWKNRPPLAISYVATDIAFPPLPTTKPQNPVTPSTTSETFDEETIQSAITSALKKMEEQHQQELRQLKLEMQNKINAVEAQMKELGQQVAVQTYQALVKEESPLATKTDHAHLKHEITVISAQLTTLINMFQSNDQSPARIPKRTKLNRTPIKPCKLDDIFTQESLSSTTSSPEEEMEGCEE